MIRAAFCRRALSFAFEVRLSQGAVLHPKAFYRYLLLTYLRVASVSRIRTE